MTTSWSWFIILIVALNILGSVWLLITNAKSGPGETTAPCGEKGDPRLCS